MYQSEDSTYSNSYGTIFESLRTTVYGVFSGARAQHEKYRRLEDQNDDDPRSLKPTSYGGQVRFRTRAFILLFMLLSLLGILAHSIGTSRSVGEKPKVQPTPEEPPIVETPKANDLLIIYAYHETDTAWENAKFFLSHAVHDAADFVFLIIGEDTKGITRYLPDDMRVVKRDNECFDLGSYGIILSENDNELVEKYERFILINASLRGPFIPSWSDACWSDIYTQPLKDGQTKLVGMTANCVPPRPHIQSMILATDRTGIKLLLSPEGLGTCYQDMISAVSAETTLTSLITGAGYKAHAMMSMANQPGYDLETCDNGDVVFDGSYNGTTLQPFDTMFVKTNRNLDEDMIGQYSQWMRGYSSYNVCKKTQK